MWPKELLYMYNVIFANPLSKDLLSVQTIVMNIFQRLKDLPDRYM